MRNYNYGYRPYGGYGDYGYNYGGYGGGSGFGTSLMGGMLGAMAGSYLYDAMTDDECAKDANGQCLQQPQTAQVGYTQEGEQPVGREDSGFGFGQYVLPPDAPLMMSPRFYKE